MGDLFRKHVFDEFCKVRFRFWAAFFEFISSDAMNFESRLYLFAQVGCAFGREAEAVLLR
jgi:hypothetical protein